MRKFFVVALMCSLGVLASSQSSWSACCIESCGTVPWTSCTADTSCTGGVCPGPIGSAIAADPDATCGVTGIFAACPTSEAGHCTDGVNNDAWTGNAFTDCQDPACFSDPACFPARAPAMHGSVLLVLGLLLALGGVVLVRQRVHRR